MNKYLTALRLYLEKNSKYKFTFNEALLYLNEKQQTTKNLVLLEKSEKESLYQIGDIQFYWNNNLSEKDLPWLFNEVFKPFSQNPSSYSHPKIINDDLDWVIDGGACEGFFSLLAAQKKTKNIVVVEPLEELKTALDKTFSLHSNGVSNFTIVQQGLGKETGNMNFTMDPDHVCDSSVGENKSKNNRSIKITTIDQISNSLKLKSKNGLIKMDIEGAEMDALSGATETLRDLKPKLAIAIYHEYDNANLCKEIILNANSSYKIEFRGMYNWFNPARPYILFAY